MRFPLSLYKDLASYTVKNALKGVRRFPLVLMLEPTHRCNIECAGCDRIRLYDDRHTDDLTLDECVSAAIECGAPVVTVTGGEPLMYRDLRPLLGALINMKRHVYLCSNGILAGQFLDRVDPHPRLTLNFHVDGLEATHDRITNKPGTFRKVIEAIKKAKARGFRVSTNTSVFKTTDPGELERLFGWLTALGVDGLLVSPAFNYEKVGSDIFLDRKEAARVFSEMDFLDKYPLIGTPMYLEFLRGERTLFCTAWGNPTRNPLGWKSPCYLITDEYYATFKEMMDSTAWERYGTGKDPRCAGCMVHSGYEATVMRTAFKRPSDLLRLLVWNLKRT